MRVLLPFIFIFIPLIASADIYKWRGENGSENFTDKAEVVPPELRENSKLKSQPLPPVLPPIANLDHVNESQVLAMEAKKPEDKKAKEKKDESVPREVIQAAISFLKDEKLKFEDVLTTKSRMNRVFKQRRNMILNTTSEKQNLTQDFAKYKTIGLILTKEFLEKSASRDADLAKWNFHASAPQNNTVKGRGSSNLMLNKLKNRLRMESAEIGVILKVLNYELKDAQ